MKKRDVHSVNNSETAAPASASVLAPTSVPGSGPSPGSGSGSDTPRFRSVIGRVTLYYTATLLLILALVFALLASIGSQFLLTSSQASVERVVRDAFDHIDFEDSSIKVAGTLDLFIEGVSLLIYDSNGVLLLGTIPTAFPASTPLISGQHQTVSPNDTQEWGIYDMMVSYRTSSIWVRGIYSTRTASTLMQQLLLAAAIVLPLLAILALVLGYLITRRAFQPIQTINRTVNEIQGSQDLARRIDVDPNRQDEIHELADNFNLLFQRLQERFEKEQQFTSDASHELRTPIAAIQAQAEHALDEATTEAERHHALERILLQSRAMSNIINQLLLLTRADRQRSQLEFELIDLGELCELVAEAEEDEASSRGIRLMTRIEDSVLVRGDQSLLLRLVMNLLSNAIKYNKENGYVALDLTKKDGQAVLTVSDSGIGIPEADLAKIFNRFYRVDQTRDRSSLADATSAAPAGEYSSGLGLSIVDWAVEAHSGSIQVQSNEGSGSSFIVRLPLVDDADTAVD